MKEKVIFKEYEFDEPLIHTIDSIVDICIRDCHNKYFHTFDHICVYDLKLTNNTKIETIKLTISGKSVGLYEINKKHTNAPQIGFIVIQINNLTIKIHSNVPQKNIHYYLKHRIPMKHRQFFKKLSKNPDYVQTHCNDRGSPFHFACRKWYFYNNPHCWYCKITPIQIPVRI